MKESLLITSSPLKGVLVIPRPREECQDNRKARRKKRSIASVHKLFCDN